VSIRQLLGLDTTVFTIGEASDIVAGSLNISVFEARAILDVETEERSLFSMTDGVDVWIFRVDLYTWLDRQEGVA
jgi:hypothetical protein